MPHQISPEVDWKKVHRVILTLHLSDSNSLSPWHSTRFKKHLIEQPAQVVIHLRTVLQTTILKNNTAHLQVQPQSPARTPIQMWRWRKRGIYQNTLQTCFCPGRPILSPTLSLEWTSFIRLPHSIFDRTLVYLQTCYPSWPLWGFAIHRVLAAARVASSLIQSPIHGSE
jgi:hypothetical protein